MANMSRKELKLFDEKLNHQNEIDHMLISKRGYYVYYNKPNRDSKPLRIHNHTCGDCFYGIGKQTQSKPGKNGVWIGPTNSIESLQKIISAIFGERSSLCSCCI